VSWTEQAVNRARFAKRGIERLILKRVAQTPFWRDRLRRKLLRQIAGDGPLRVILGGGHYLPYPGWHLTERETLDVTEERAWLALFGDRLVDNLLAEHVWEHLTPEAGLTAARLCLRQLRPGGVLRIAVPDGLHPVDRYIAAVEPGGTGKAALDHKILYDYRSLGRTLEEAGFDVRLLEHWDERRQFHHEPFSFDAGRINRRPRFSPGEPAFVRGVEYSRRNADSEGREEQYPFNYTSLIVDAVRPATSPARP
jgi:predicted SAM-dependent methyltransferase